MDTSQWAEENFGSARLGDERRTRRLVKLAQAMLKAPTGSIPQQSGNPNDTIAAYRFLNNPKINRTMIQQAHIKKTLEKAHKQEWVLFIEDTTYVDLTGRQVKDMGVIGDGRGNGFVVHSTLAVIPETKEVLGLAHQTVHRRPPKKKRETSYQLTKRKTEAHFWTKAVEQIGAAPLASHWVYVGDRGSDFFPFFGACRAHNADFLTRIRLNRVIDRADGGRDHLVKHLRELPAQHQFTVQVTDKKKQPRAATVQLSYTALTMHRPVHPRKNDPPNQWMYGIRVWELDAPSDVEDPIEWLLVTSLPVHTSEEAEKYVHWYADRPIIEDYHQCLKTGCYIEKRQFHSADAYERLIALTSVNAIYLLQLRDGHRRCVTGILNNDMNAVIAASLEIEPEELTTQQAWHWIAQCGGYMNRKRDPPPGWKAIWAGWQKLLLMMDGFRLAKRAPPQ